MSSKGLSTIRIDLILGGLLRHQLVPLENGSGGRTKEVFRSHQSLVIRSQCELKMISQRNRVLTHAPNLQCI